MNQETFCLKLKNHEAHLITTFRDLFNETRFSDVTLVSDDQTQLPAHKIVLSAFSPVLGNILLNNPHPHPLLYLKGVKHREMQSMLQFMYLGEVSILQEGITQFIDVAKELQVKDLSQKDTYEEDQNNVDEVIENCDQDINDIFVEETICVPNTLVELVAFDMDTPEYKVGLSSASEVEQGKQNYNCSDCGKGFACRLSLLRHQQSKHVGVKFKYSCNKCDYQATDSRSLKRHQQSKHEGVRYSCDQCEYHSTQQCHLK